MSPISSEEDHHQERPQQPMSPGHSPAEPEHARLAPAPKVDHQVKRAGAAKLCLKPARSSKSAPTRRPSALQEQPQPQAKIGRMSGSGEQLKSGPPGADQSEQRAEGSSPPVEENVCAGCFKRIRERYLLAALDKRWHEDCLKCACCDCRLGEVGSSLFTHSGKILCRRDFLRIFGQQGQCAACKKTIPPYELVMRANELAYHMDCFACQQCQYRFCVGDRYHLSERHRILCLLCHTDQQSSSVTSSALGSNPTSLADGGAPTSGPETPALPSSLEHSRAEPAS